MPGTSRRCRRCKTQLFKRPGPVKSVAGCSLERALANPGLSNGVRCETGRKKSGARFTRTSDIRSSTIEPRDDRRHASGARIVLPISDFLSGCCALTALRQSHAPVLPELRVAQLRHGILGWKAPAMIECCVRCFREVFRGRGVNGQFQ